MTNDQNGPRMTVICYGDSNTYGYDPRGWLGVRFADAGAWGVGFAYDGVHFTGQGHRAFAEGIRKELAP